MNINTDTMVSMTEANRNFSRVAKLVDEKGAAVILKNNRPRYVLLDFSQAEEMADASDEDVLSVSRRMILKNRAAYDELAK
ncbi:MAG: type II toxin-antitoxin system Phd/YefM family antitoxin [Alistipes senegalensis]|nr:type II toxin-antitoxin system Phd/YefM family antitoxin [Oxalobacter formigenes]MCM1280372.1 type II toxin-antitoxin system Phd/YefM family antitoxin [Alistipes senegalensis]